MRKTLHDEPKGQDDNTEAQHETKQRYTRQINKPNTKI